MNVNYQTLARIAQRANLNESRSLSNVIFTDYSGRGMYGRECVAFCLEDDSQMLDLGAAIAEVADEPFGRATTDSLGLRMVAYFKSVQCTDDPNREYEEN
jgi:hypothetical protein